MTDLPRRAIRPSGRRVNFLPHNVLVQPPYIKLRLDHFIRSADKRKSEKFSLAPLLLCFQDAVSEMFWQGEYVLIRVIRWLNIILG
jgi:hypothetical protein